MARHPARTTSRPDLGKLEHDLDALVVNLRAVVKRRKTGEKLFEVGAPWHRGEGLYLERTDSCKVIEINEAQLEPARAIREWIEARREGRPRRIALTFEGARGSGKTHVGLLAVWLIAIAFPGARCWLVSPANTRRDELDAITHRTIPIHWRRAWSQRDFTYTLPNGSTVVYIGADDEDALKQGGYEVCLLNEAQLMTVRAYVNAAAGIRNRDERPKGLLLLAMNYSTKPRGDWTDELLDNIDAGKVNAQRFVMDPALNQSIEADTKDEVDRLSRAASPELADVDAQGKRRRFDDLAAPAFKWAARELGGHVGEPPQIGWRNVTREATAKRSGNPKGYAAVCAADFQQRPGCVGVWFQIYEREDGKRVYVAEKFIGADGNEDDLARRIAEYAASQGLDARDVLIVADSTGRHQNAARTGSKPSHAILREWFFDVYSPQRIKVSGGFGISNPDVPDSLAQFADVCDENRLLVLPSEEWLITSLRKCKTKKRGYSLRLDDAKPGYSHAVDCCRYATWYFEPKRGPVKKPRFDHETFDELSKIRGFPSI
jgi:hypothetical protein